MKTIAKMEQFSDVEYVYPNSIVDNFQESIRYTGMRLGLISRVEMESNIRRVKLSYDRRPDVVLSHRRIPADTSGVPCIWQFAVLDPEMQMSVGQDLWSINRQYTKMNEALPYASALQVSTESEVSRHREIFPNVSNIVSVPFFLFHCNALSAENIRQKQLDDNTIKILFVGREARRKGLDLALSAIDLLDEKIRRRISFTIVSNFSDGVVEAPRKFEVKHYKSLSTNDVQSLMHSSHVFIMPSRFESFGFTLVEAMAAGCCVIGPNWEVQKDILSHGTCGLNVAPRMEAVALALERIIDRDLRLSLAQAAIDRFNRVYSAEQVSRKYFDMFLSVI